MDKSLIKEEEEEKPHPHISHLFPIFCLLNTFINIESGIIPAATNEIKTQLDINNV